MSSMWITLSNIENASLSVLHVHILCCVLPSESVPQLRDDGCLPFPLVWQALAIIQPGHTRLPRP